MNVIAHSNKVKKLGNVMNKEANKMQVYIKEDYIQIKNMLNELASLIEIKELNTDEKSGSLLMEKVGEIDIIIIDIDTDSIKQINEIKKLKDYNPEMKTILYTGEKNRKYRSYFLNRGIDFFVFKETESKLLQSILTQIHLRKTRFDR